MLARGTTAKPFFERISVPLGDREAATITLPALPDGALLPEGSAAAAAAKKAAANAAAARAAGDATVVGADNAGAAILLPRVPAALADAGRKRREPEAANGPAHPLPLAGGASDDEATGEAALGERVARLEASRAPVPGSRGPPLPTQPPLSKAKQARMAADEAKAAAAGRARGDGAGAGPSSAAAAAAATGPVRADSLGVLLAQALRSDDRALLERCLNVGDARVINNTVRALVPADAALLLRSAVERLQSRPARGAALGAWLRAGLLYHAGYLMAAPGTAAVLTALYQCVEARASAYKPLLSLCGRLELVLAQAPRARGGGGGSAAYDDPAPPLATYREAASDEEASDSDASEEEASEDPFAGAGARRMNGFGGAGGGSDSDSDD